MTAILGILRNFLNVSSIYLSLVSKDFIINKY